MKKIKTYKQLFESNTEININIEEMVRGYIHSALWTEELDSEYGIDDFTKEEIEYIRKDVIVFINRVKEIIKKINGDEIIPFINKYSSDSFGHDLWLTRNGHGTGFWDRKELDIAFTPSKNPYDKEYILGDVLTAIANEMGESELYFEKPDKDKQIKRFNL